MVKEEMPIKIKEVYRTSNRQDMNRNSSQYVAEKIVQVQNKNIISNTIEDQKSHIQSLVY